MAWPCVTQFGRARDDRLGATARIADAVKRKLVSNCIDVDSTKISDGLPCEDRSLREGTDFDDYITNGLQSTPNTSNVLFLFQQHSRAPLDLTADGLTSLLLKLDAFTAIAKVFESFVPDETGGTLGRASVHFDSTRTPPDISPPIFELCALMKYISVNHRDPKGSKANSWSIRNLGFYQRHDPATKSETVLFINVSDALGLRMKQTFNGVLQECKPYDHWTHMPMLVASTLPANWSTFVADLHAEVTQLSTDSAFTDPNQARVGEANVKSLGKCNALLDKLQHAIHALQSNLDILTAMKQQAKKRQRIQASSFDPEYDDFESGIDDTLQELSFTREHIVLIMSRLDRTTSMIRDLISLRSTRTIEKLTVRSMVEARTVRLIAIVSMLFIPPTFTTVGHTIKIASRGDVLTGNDQSFIQADMVHPFSSSTPGLLQLSADLDLWFWLAITVPLMLVTLGGWLYWDWRTTRKMSRELDWHV